ncbi:MAG: YhfC family intramembrane metalloprotease [Crocinitomix sp.]|nr:YhfC family intramembrane metalloprotease [Crocinitomix sp.]
MKSKIKLTPYIRNILWAAPLYFLVPLPFFLLAHFIDIKIDYNAVLLGALGWWVALLLRLPVILFVKLKKFEQKKSNKLIVGFSGPTEEVTRLVLLLIIGLNAPNAYSVGLGWAMIEIVYGLIQIIGIGVLEQKTDAKAIEAKNLMKQMGMDKSLAPSTPFWGALERVTAGAVHIGFSLLLVFSPYALIVTIPLHSFINFLVVKMNKTSIRKSQLNFLIIGCVILILGIILT